MAEKPGIKTCVLSKGYQQMSLSPLLFSAVVKTLHWGEYPYSNQDWVRVPEKFTEADEYLTLTPNSQKGHRALTISNEVFYSRYIHKKGIGIGVVAGVPAEAPSSNS
jgi:hypothetical protein